MRRSRLLCAIAAAAVMGVTVLGPAAPASAAATNIVITGPGAGQTFTGGVTSAPVAIAGNAHIGGGLAENNVLTDIQVVATGSSLTYSCAHAADCGATVGVGATNFSFTPVVTRNGPYSVAATVTGNECGVLGCAQRSSTATTNFSVGVRPAAPRSVRAQVNGDMTVTVSWAPNPEPDVIGYQVMRSGPGGNKTVAPFLQGTSVQDSGTTAGGSFSYIVTAFRPGADGTSTPSTVLSASSGAAGANVALPPAPTTTVGPVGQPVVVTTTTTTVTASNTPATPDLSLFLNQAQQAGAIPPAPPKAAVHSSPGPTVKLPSVGAPVAPPDTYAPTLPYAAPALAGGVTGGAGVAQVPLRRQPASHHGRPLVVPVVGGLMLCAVGVLVGLANRRRPSLKPLEPAADADTGPAMPGPARSGGNVQPASALAKAAARAAAAATLATGNGIRPAAGAAAAAPVGPVGPAARSPRGGLPERSVFDRPAPPVPATAAPAQAPQVPSTDGPAATRPRVVTAPATSAPTSAPATPALPASASAPAPAPALPLPPLPPLPTLIPAMSAASPGAEGARWRRAEGRPLAAQPSIEDAVDYFRLIRLEAADTGPPQKIDAGAPPA